jgi:hypothetical protein
VAGLVAGCALALASTPLAAASSGVSVDLGRIEISQQLSPGGAYTLPTIGVSNPGSEATSYVMVASPVADPAFEAPPASWFEFSPPGMTLAPGETRPIHVRIVLPADAPPGDYIALVGAQIANPGPGATVGAAAAARTTFTVQSSNAPGAAGHWIGRTLADTMPWSGLLIGMAVIAIAILLLRRRFAFGVRIERR